MAWLNGHQDHFTMVGGQESTRSTLHPAELFRLADNGPADASRNVVSTADDVVSYLNCRAARFEKRRETRQRTGFQI